MTGQRRQNSGQRSSEPRESQERPRVYDVCFPRPYVSQGEDKTDFVRCGVAFAHRDGPGFTVQLYFAQPAGAELVMLPWKERGK